MSDAPTCQACTAPTDAFLCRDCGDSLSLTLLYLPMLIEALIARAAGLARTERSSSRALQEPDERRGSLPANLASSELLHEVRNALVTWARHLAESRGAEDRLPTVQADDSYVAAALVRWLLEHVESIRFDQAAGDILADFRRLSARLERAVNSMPARFWAGPCDGRVMTKEGIGACGRDLYAVTNPFTADAKLDAVITCDGWRGDGRGCGKQHEVGRRLDWIMAETHDALVPLAVLRMVARAKEWPWPSPQVITNWQARGQLAPRGLSRTGEELFRGGDVLDLVQRWAGARAKSERMAG